MRHWLCAMSTAAILASGSAFAADLGRGPPPAPVPPPPLLFSWTGFYLGANAGGQSSQSHWTYTGQPFVNNHNEHSGIVGGQVGYNLEFGDNWVAGLEGSLDWGDAEHGSLCPVTVPPSGFNCNTLESWLGDLSGRLGYAMGRTLLFAKGGVAFESINHHFPNFNAAPQFTFGTGWTTMAGWLIGGGVEHAFTPNWTAKIEFDYMDFGNHTFTGPPLFPPFLVGAAIHERQTTSVVKVGLNYLFDATPAVAARY